MSISKVEGMSDSLVGCISACITVRSDSPQQLGSDVTAELKASQLPLQMLLFPAPQRVRHGQRDLPPYSGGSCGGAGSSSDFAFVY